MALPKPNLDDRTFQDIVDEAKRLIPTYCPEWTDHNVSDPGVTLIELFAWMVEMMLFRLNQLPEKSQVTFMEMMGVRLEPPKPAQTALTFWLSTSATETVTIPAGTEVATLQTATEPAITFSTDRDLAIQPPKLRGLLTSADGRIFTDQWWTLRFPHESFQAFSPRPKPGDAIYLGFEADPSNLTLGLLIDCTIEGIGVDPTNPPLMWEAFCEEHGWTGAPMDRDQAGVLTDTTGGLNQRGQVVVHLPPDMTRREINGKQFYWLRCRHTEPKPRQPTYQASPQIHNLEVVALGGTVDATQGSMVIGELVGRSDGMPGQIFRLEYVPILPRREGETVEVQQTDGSWRAWLEREDFAETRPSDRHYVLDSVSGELSFGPFIREPDGSGRQYGAIPAQGSQIRFRRYRSGGGSRGNVKLGDLTILKTTIPYVHRVANRQPASGGRDAETIERAKLRAPQVLRTSERAVTVEDYEFLAMEASSGVARARCLQPGAVGAPAGLPPGVVRVLLVPQLTPCDGYIEPDRLHVPERVIKEVQRDLDKRRLLTSRVEIDEPEYRWVTANVRAKLSREADPKVVQSALEAQLYKFLNPLAGGADGQGWPFGATLHISQVYATLQGLPGIDYIERVNLRLEGNDELRDSIPVPPNALIASAKHSVILL